MHLPHTIGRYAFLELLGEGGNGGVYRGRETGALGLRHDVVLRLLTPDAVAEGGAAFTDELQALGGVAHPAVVEVRDLVRVDAGPDGARVLLVVPFVRGALLSSLLRRSQEQGAPLPLEASLHLLLQLVDGLEAVHQASDVDGRSLRLAHGGLTADNLVVSPQGDLRILDFGLRRVRPRKNAGVESRDDRADLYDVGIIAYEMLLGETFTGTLVDRTSALQDQLRGAHALSPGEAEHITDLLVRLLQTDRERRFPHARSVGAALGALAGDRLVRRARRWLAGVVGGAPLGDRPGLGAPVARSLPDTEPPPAPRGSPALPLLVAAMLVGGLGIAWLAGGTPEPPRVELVRVSDVPLPVAPESAPSATLTHAPPLPLPGTGDRVFRAMLRGDAVECVPRLQLRAAGGGPWVSKPMRGDGRSWELRVDYSELVAFPGGAEYWIRCGLNREAPTVQWRSEENPALLTL
ncbi:MAG: protein kinase [Deltaproteobacteria bacterium]|nr:protein kinase [Deltaproteobacteria bacterium]